jgi:hypothetical protein
VQWESLVLVLDLVTIVKLGNQQVLPAQHQRDLAKIVKLENQVLLVLFAKRHVHRMLPTRTKPLVLLIW